MSTKNKRRIAGCCLCLLTAAALWIALPRLFRREEPVIYYFYEEACASCDPEGEFYSLFYDRLADVPLPEELDIRCYNQFTSDGALWDSLCEERGIPQDKRTLPMVIAGEGAAFGEEDIRRQLRSLTCQLYGLPDTGTIWYYYRPDCQDCIRIRPLLEKTLAEFPELSVIAVDTTDLEPKEAYKEKLRSRQTPQEDWQVPFLDNGQDYLSGDQAIEEGLRDFLTEKCGAGQRQ